MDSVSQTFALALQYHRAGRLAEAETLYRQVLAAQPQHAEALHHLGVIAHQVGRQELAVEWIRQSLALQPKNPTACSNLAGALSALGRRDEAMAACRRAIELQPDHAAAHNNLGNALLEAREVDAAASAFRRALELEPDFPEAHNNLGNALRDQRHAEEAIVEYRRALELRPAYPEARNNLGIALREKGQSDEAITEFQRALQLKPEYAEAHNNLGNALKDQRRFDEAIVAYRSALRLRPTYADALNNLGLALKERGDLDAAIAALRQAVQLQPGSVEAHSNLGTALAQQRRLEETIECYHRALGLDPNRAGAHYNLAIALGEFRQFDEAIAAYERALQLQPDHEDAKFGYANVLLLLGEFEQGWPLYESRWHHLHAEKRTFREPSWNGEDLAGKRILLYAEQGFGDSIQFIRYARLLAERGGEVLLECQSALAELFRPVKGVSKVFALGDPLPPFDFHVAMLSQPLIFQTRIESIPADVPYLFADTGRREAWQKRLGSERSRLRVGLAWASNPENPMSRLRDVPLRMLAPLFEVKDVDFFSLQIGPGAEQLREFPSAAAVANHTRHITDFADTAALMAELDLIISVDTAVAHLAGALGQKVWTLLPFAADWRWGLEREDNPWYPTMRLFRQPVRDDWTPVIQRVAGELNRTAAGIS